MSVKEDLMTSPLPETDVDQIEDLTKRIMKKILEEEGEQFKREFVELKQTQQITVLNSVYRRLTTELMPESEVNISFVAAIGELITNLAYDLEMDPSKIIALVSLTWTSIMMNDYPELKEKVEEKLLEYRAQAPKAEDDLPN